MIVRLMCTAALAAAIVAPLAAQVEKKEMAGVRNYSRVDATVGCAGATDPAAMKALKGEGYAAVINLRLPTEEGSDVDGERTAATAAGMKYIHIPFNAAAPDPKAVDTFLAAVADKSNQPVFIHCGSAGRVAAVWMVKRVLQDKWDVARAQKEADAIGTQSPGLRAFVTDYIAKHQ